MPFNSKVCRHPLELAHCLKCGQPFLVCRTCHPDVPVCQACERPSIWDPYEMERMQRQARQAQARERGDRKKMERAKVLIRKAGRAHANRLKLMEMHRLKRDDPQRYRQIVNAPAKQRYKRRLRREHPQLLREQERRYREKNRLELNERMRRYRAEKGEQVNARRRERYKERKAAGACTKSDARPCSTPSDSSRATPPA